MKEKIKQINREELIINAITVVTSLLVFLFVIFLFYFVYTTYTVSDNMISLDYDEDVKSLTGEVVTTGSVQKIKKDIKDIKSKYFYEKSDLINILQKYSQIGEIGKGIAVGENYLELTNNSFEENKRIHHHLGLFYQEACNKTSKDNFCKESLKHFRKLAENNVSHKYYANIAKVLRMMGEDKKASKVFSIFKNKKEQLEKRKERIQNKVKKKSPDVDKEGLDIKTTGGTVEINEITGTGENN